MSSWNVAVECGRRIVQRVVESTEEAVADVVVPELWVNTTATGWTLAATGTGEWRLLPVDWEAEPLPDDVAARYGGSRADQWHYATFSPPMVAAVGGAHPTDWIVGDTMPNLGGPLPAIQPAGGTSSCRPNVACCNVVVEGAFVATGRHAAEKSGGGLTVGAGVVMWLQCVRSDGVAAYLPIGPVTSLPTAIPLWPWHGGGGGGDGALFSTSGTFWHVSPLTTMVAHGGAQGATADARCRLYQPSGMVYGDDARRQRGDIDRRRAASSSDDAAHLDGTRVCTLDVMAQSTNTTPSSPAAAAAVRKPPRRTDSSPSYGDREPFADDAVQRSATKEDGAVGAMVRGAYGTQGGGDVAVPKKEAGLPCSSAAVPFYFSDSSAPSSPTEGCAEEDSRPVPGHKGADGGRRGTCAPHEPLHPISATIPRTELRRPLRAPIIVPTTSSHDSSDTASTSSEDSDDGAAGLGNRVIGNAASILQGVHLPTRKDAFLALQQHEAHCVSNAGSQSFTGITAERPSATSQSWEESAVELGSEGSVAVLSSIFNDVEPLRSGATSVPSSRSNRVALNASGRLGMPPSLSASLSGARPLSITRRVVSAVAEPALPFQQPPIGSGGAPVFLILAATPQTAHRGRHPPNANLLRRAIKINRACPWVVGVNVYGVTLCVGEHGLAAIVQSVSTANMVLTPAAHRGDVVRSKRGLGDGSSGDEATSGNSSPKQAARSPQTVRELRLLRPTAADTTRCGPYLSYEVASTTNRSIVELEGFLRGDPRVRKYVTAGGVGGSFGHAPAPAGGGGIANVAAAVSTPSEPPFADGLGAAHLFSLSDQQLRSFQMCEVLLKFLAEAPSLRLPRWLLETLPHHRDEAKSSPLPSNRRPVGG